MAYCEDLETGDCLDSEYLGPDAPRVTSAQDDAFTLLSTALVQFGERGVPTLLQTGEMEIMIEWQSALAYCVNVICWGDGRYQLYVFDREMIGHLWQPTTLVDEPRAGLDDVAAALRGYVEVLDQQDATRSAVPADLV